MKRLLLIPVAAMVVTAAICTAHELWLKHATRSADRDLDAWRKKWHAELDLVAMRVPPNVWDGE